MAAKEHQQHDNQVHHVISLLQRPLLVSGVGALPLFPLLDDDDDGCIISDDDDDDVSEASSDLPLMPLVLDSLDF